MLRHKLKSILHVPEYKYGSGIIIRWLWRAWRGNRLQAVLNAVVGMLMVAVSLMQVWAVKHAIDVASHAVQGNIFSAVAVMGCLIICNFALGISAVWIKNILGIRAQNRMQQQMLDRLLRSEWHGKERFHSGDVLNRLEFDVTTVVSFLTETLPSALSVAMLFTGSFVYLYFLDRTLAVVIIAVVPVFLLLSKVYVRQMRSLTKRVRDYDSKVQSALQETIQHRMLIKTLESVSVMVDRLENTQCELRHRVVRRTKFRIFSNLILNTGFSLTYLLAFLWAALRMMSHTLTFGGMTAYLQLVGKIQGPARDLTRLIPAFVGVFTSAERLMELEETPLEKSGTPRHIPAPTGIRIDNVCYKYDTNEGNVIDNLSFDFPPGTCTAVVGETGAGKTTLVRMLLALLRPQKGQIVIYGSNGQVCEEVSPLHRCNFVYVPQGNTLLSGTIRDNLRLGNMAATDEQMRAALEASCADFVFSLPDGLDTVCSEQGGGLSEGQAQRIAIARGLLRNRSIMLFDEATSALDPETERKLLENILTDKTKTIIFITHRPAVTEYCDQVLRIERTSH